MATRRSSGPRPSGARRSSTRAASPSRRRAPRRRWLLAAGAALVAAGLGASLVVDGADPEGRDGSRPVEGGPVAVVRTPVRYRIEYRVEGEGPDRRERLSVRRPFDSRIDELGGDGAVRSSSVATFARYAPTESLVIVTPPAVAPGDVRLRDVLPEALAQGLVERRERREVLGRACTVYRSADPLAAGVLAPGTATRHADTCVDAAGLPLEVLTVADGEVLVRKVAVAVDEDPSFPDGFFAVAGEPIPASEGGGSVLRVAPDSRPIGTSFVLDGPPEGFVLSGRYSVVPPQPDVAGDPARSGERQAGVSDVYVRGADLVVVDQGATLRGAPPFPAPEGETVDLGAVGRGEVLVTPQGNEVRALLGGGRYLRVSGTVPADELVALARRLRPVEGTGLVYLDRPAG